MYDLRAPRSLVDALFIPSPSVRDTILELFFDIFRIKPPSWSSSFLAGRRLTSKSSRVPGNVFSLGNSEVFFLLFLAHSMYSVWEGGQSQVRILRETHQI